MLLIIRNGFRSSHCPKSADMKYRIELQISEISIAITWNRRKHTKFGRTVWTSEASDRTFMTLKVLALHIFMIAWIIRSDPGKRRIKRHSWPLNKLIKPRDGLIESLFLCELLTWLVQVAPNRETVNGIGVQVDLPRNVHFEENVLRLSALLGRKDLIGFYVTQRSASRHARIELRDTNQQQQY